MRYLGDARLRSIAALLLVVALIAPLAQSADADAGGIVSDSFDGSLDTSRWTFVNPVGDGSVSTSGGRVHLSVPAGTDHDLWTNSWRAPWLRQAAPNSDFEVELKFDSVVSARYHIQGFVAAQDTANLVRFDVHHDGTSARLFAASFAAGVGKTRLNVALSGTPPYLRIARTGNTWTYRYSFDGASWQTGTSFAHTIAVSGVGPFVGNAGNNPAFTATVDYFQNAGSGPPPSDTSPPVISGLGVDPSATAAVVSWTTNEPSTTRVDYGITANLGSTVQNASTVVGHSIVVPGLSCATTYHYRVVSADAAGNIAVSPTSTFQTDGCGGGTTIDVWYGNDQTFGARGQPQTWVNVLGNVSDPSGITALSYRLNGGASRALSRGPDNRRLQKPGDFNVEIDFDELANGANSIVISATNGSGQVTTRTVTVRKVYGSTALPYTTNFGAASSAQAVVQPVDGYWTIQGNQLRISKLGYDRLALIGDLGWTDFEATVPFTPHALGPDAYSYLSGNPLIGLALRWQGHTDREVSSPTQPKWWWYPTGAFAWCYWPQGTGQQCEIKGDGGSPTVKKKNLTFAFGVQYYVKVRVETVAGGTRYQMKWWSAGQAEPATWALTTTDTGPASGSLGLLAHHMDVSFGNVTVVPV